MIKRIHISILMKIAMQYIIFNNLYEDGCTFKSKGMYFFPKIDNYLGIFLMTSTVLTFTKELFHLNPVAFGMQDKYDASMATLTDLLEAEAQ